MRGNPRKFSWFTWGIFAIVLVAAFAVKVRWQFHVKDNVLVDKNRTILNGISAALSMYYLHFDASPPDGHAAGSRLQDMTGSECLAYYLMTPFRPPDEIASEPDPEMRATMIAASKHGGPFYEAEETYLKDLDDDGHVSLLDALGSQLHYDEAPDPSAYGRQQADETPFVLWSSGVNRSDEKGKGDDVLHWP